jgi:hypothetical protein
VQAIPTIIILPDICHLNNAAKDIQKLTYFPEVTYTPLNIINDSLTVG